MNRSILIVIVDFLLVTLLAFSTTNIQPAPDTDTPPTPKTDIGTNSASGQQDLAVVMRLALEDERKGRDVLQGELSRTRETAGKQQELLTERDRQLQAFQQQLQNSQQQLQTSQQQLQARQIEAERLQQEQTNLQKQITESTTMSSEKLAAIEAELKKKSDQAEALRQQVDQLGRSNLIVLNEKQQLSGQLQVAEAEKRSATEQASRLREDVKVEREEKAKLAEGVKALASTSGELAKEVRDNRAQTPNAIFSEFLTNRVRAQFSAYRPALFGANHKKETETVLITDGTNIYAMSHIQDTPLTLYNPGTDWQGLIGILGREPAQVQVQSMSFHSRDPRVVLFPVTKEQAKSLGCRIYRISADPFKFQDAVLVGAKEGYYGECKFQIDLSTPEYVKLDNNFIKGLFGKFNPSRGDLVFSKNDELLGVMANGTYCLRIHDFNASATFRFGNDVPDQHTGPILSQLYTYVSEMPFKLQ